MFCRHCGKEIEADSKFCKFCGGGLVDSTSKHNLMLSRIKVFLQSWWIKTTFYFKSLQQFKSGRMANKSYLKKTFRLIVLFILIIGLLVGIGYGIWYYFYEVRPERKAVELLESVKSDLNSSSGTALYWKCDNIIRDHTIPKSGKDRRDSQNLRELTDYAWDKITFLAEQGNAEAQFMLGVKYNGYDFWEGKWINEEKPNSNSHRFLLRTPYDYDKAAYWYLKAAEQNHSGAQNNLGNCYMYGRGVEKNIKEAIKWYRLSASNGDDYGQLSLGDCFRDGHKIQIGEHWEKSKGAVYHDWTTKFGYHQIPEYEIVIQQDIDSAKYYWEKSAAQGNTTAKERLQKIY